MKRLLAPFLLWSFSAVVSAQSSEDMNSINYMSAEVLKSKIYGEAATCFYALDQLQRVSPQLKYQYLPSLTPNSEELKNANFYNLYIEHAKLAANSMYNVMGKHANNTEFSRDEFTQRMINTIAVEAEKEIDRGMREYSIKTREWSTSVMSNNACGSAGSDLRGLNSIMGMDTLPFKG